MADEYIQENKPESKPSPADRIRPYMWPPGVSGNPGGRPKGPSAVTALLAEIRSEEDLGRDRLRSIGRRLLDLAEAGNTRAIELLYDRLDGRVAQQIDLQGGPIRVVWPHEIDRSVSEDTEVSETEATGVDE